jgi:hypothetical protein
MMAIYIMLEKIPGGQRINKLRTIQLLEADLNQVLGSSFARNVSKLAQETPGIISEHKYGKSHQTRLFLNLNKLLEVQLLIQNKTNGIVFDNDTKGCYDRFVSEIALTALRQIGYSKDFIRMTGILWSEYTINKLLYGIGQGS